MIQPNEAPIGSYPKGNYSKSSVSGELVTGTTDENGVFTSYASVYAKGVTGEAVYDYLKVQPTTEQINQMLGEGNELKEGESITWYVIKKEGDGYHVDGFVTGQKFDITVRYGYTDAESGKFIDLTESKTETVGLGENYSIDSPVIDEYIAETAKVEGIATKNETLYVEYTAEETRPVTINYYRGSITGTLLGTQTVNVAVSKVDAYASTIKTNWLNLKKPADCYDGEMISYVVTKDSAVANVVYAPIPVTPVTPPAPTTPVVEPGEGEPIVAEAEAPAAPVNVIAAPVDEEPVDEEPVEEAPVEIEEEETPLAPAIEDDEADKDGIVITETDGGVIIEDEETPLGVGNCWIHWLILILTAVYTVYELVRAISRNKKIKELAGNGETAEA